MNVERILVTCMIGIGGIYCLYLKEWTLAMSLLAPMVAFFMGEANGKKSSS